MPQKYRKYEDPRNHILHRPDTVAGSIVFKKMKQYVCVVDPSTGLSIQSRQINYNPGLSRIFMEVISNAHDNIIRSKETSTPVKHVKVVVSDEFIEVYNDGLGIRMVEVTNENGDVIKGSLAPEVIFGELQSGSNFDDNEARNTSGRNGYGAKLTNIFSKEFTVEAYDEESGKIFLKTWSENMSKKTDTKFKKGKGKSGWTRVRFQPDYKRFGCEKLPDEMKAYYHKLVVDVAMQQPKTEVTFNGEVVKIRNLEDYSHLYVGSQAPLITFKSGDSNVVVVDCSAKIEDTEEEKEDKDKEEVDKSPQDDDTFAELRQSIAGSTISFVNGILVEDGGIHVDTWTEAIIRPLFDKLSRSLRLTKKAKKDDEDKKEKKTKDEKEKEKKRAEKEKLKPTWMKLNISDIRKHLAIFIVCTLDKPSFDTQTKVKLNAPAPKVVEPTEFQLNKMVKWPFRKHIEYMMRAKSLAGQKSTDATRDGWRNIEKHTRANWFRTKKALKATLIVTEGDSAKGSAIASLKALEGGNDAYGVYALRGKLLNTRAASITQINKNKEIAELKQILGLKHGVDYSDDKSYSSLNYGKLQIWTDQDLDGDHIKGLILNWFEENYPALIKRGFVTVMNTPIVIAKVKKETIYFYEIDKFRKWYSEQIEAGVRGISVAYFKGLGTFEKRQIQTVVKEEHKVLSYTLDNKEDSEAMSLAFSKLRANDRKAWIQAYQNNPIDPSQVTQLSLADFVNRCLRSYSVSTLQRAIPSVLDGLKEGQRKILHVCRDKNINTPVKVTSVAADVTKYGAYHHGESSLEDTIIHLAQCWPGRNTLPLMLDQGNFGYRFTGAGNYSQSRYLFSCLTPIAKAIFRTEDDSLLTYMDDDGKSIEPEHFMPILPLILFNNMEGIATGWNSKTPSFNPLDVITWIRAYLEGTVSHENPLLPQGQLKPWYIHFKGTVELDEPKEGATYAETFTITGQVSRENGHVIITDLPPKVVPCAYLTFLDKLETKKKIQKYENHSGSDEIHIDITLNSNDLSDDQLKLKAKGSFKGMILLDKKGLPKRFYSAEDVLLYWCPIRLDYYQARKDHLIEVTKTDIMFCKNRIRFITEVNDDTLVIRNRELSEVTTEMESTGYDKKDDKYDYLLSMPIQTISKTRLAKLEDELISKKKELARYKKMTPGDFWETDLATFEIEYQKHLEDRLEKAREPFETREKKKVVRRKKSTV
jgi:DNA topoisomerase-2